MNADVVHIDIPELPQGARPMRLRRLPVGIFLIGSASSERGRWLDEGPSHQVTFAFDFWMGETEITQSQFAALMGDDHASSAHGKGPNHPVYNVTRNEAHEFLQRAQSLLPPQPLLLLILLSEAMWEYACRANTFTRFWFGNILDCSDTVSECPEAEPYMWWCGMTCPQREGQ